MIRINFPDQTYLDVIASDESYRYRSIMGKYEVTLKFSLTEYVHFASGCWIDYKGQTYYCLTEGSLKKNARNEYEYSVTFEPHAGKLRLWTLRNYATDEFKFSAAYTPREAVEVIVETLNNRDGGWSVGECLEADHKTFDFNNTKLDTALSMIASEFNTEYEIVDKTIHLRKVEYGKDTPLALSYGKGNGFLPGVGVVSTGKQAQFEILLIQGGEQNLDRSRYDSPRWHLPKNALMEYNGVTYQTDAKGREVTIAGKQLTSKVDLTLDLSEMYPKRVGVVSAVEVIDAESRFVDILDLSIPEDLDYSKYRSAGETATITFQSGMLAGRTFDIEQSADNLTGYIHAERRFKLVPKTEDGVEMPDTTNGVFMPAVGDKYAVFGVMLPDAYVNSPSTKTGVEWDMFREACRYFDEKNVVPFSFTGTIDPNWARQDWINRGGMLEPGWFVRFSDPDFKPDGYDIRIVGMRDYANDACKVSIELSNDVVSSNLSTDFAKIDGEQQRLDREKSALKDYSKRGYADVLRTTEMLIGAGLSGFTESVQPLTVQTMQLLVGATECQFVFVDSKTEPQTVVSRVQVFDKASKQFTCAAGILKHLTIGIDYVSANHQAGEYRYWDMPLFTSAALTDKAGYYVYARCSKAGNTGTFKLSQTAIKLESETGWYHFLVGILNPEIDTARSYAPMYGFSAIEPGRMIVDKIQSSDFDWDTFTGACIDLASNPKRLIFGDNAEIITRKLTIKHPQGEDYDLVEMVNNVCSENIATDLLADWAYTHSPLDSNDGYEEDFAYVTTGRLIDISNRTTSKLLIQAVESYQSGTATSDGIKINVRFYDEAMLLNFMPVYIKVPKSSTTKIEGVFDIPSDCKNIRISMRFYSDTQGVENTFMNDQWKTDNPISRDMVKFGVYLGTFLNGYINPSEDYLKQAMQNGSTEIKGGLALTNIIMAKDLKGQIRSGMSGIADDNIGLWTGGSYQDALSNLAKIILRKDGSGHLAGGNVAWETDGDLTIKGKLEGTEGSFGVFRIIANSMIGENGDNIIQITTDNIPTLNSLTSSGGIWTTLVGRSEGTASGGASEYEDEDGRTGGNEYNNDALITEFSLQETSFIRLIGGDISQFEMNGNGGITGGDNLTFYVTTKIANTKLNLNNALPAGTYRVWGHVDYRGVPYRPSPGWTNSVDWSCTIGLGSVEVSKNRKEVVVGNNGVCVFSNEGAYFYVSKEYGIEAKFGTGGLKLDATNGLQKWDDKNKIWINL